jgi:YidC/Oxa1 family membrane protein insertase
MQKLAPMLEELKKKYAGNPQKLNQETADLYKREGVNPMSGCLPMLLQIPIFFAMYGLFSNHFDLRGAAFIPGWIGDLSAPESIWSFAPHRLPLVDWTDLRLLPILFVGTQVASSMVTQTPSSASGAQMKIMLYGMPIVFFFILYNVPSGLLVYWIVMNVLTAVQQWYINGNMKKKASA